MTDDVTFIMRRSFLDKIEKLPKETYLKLLRKYVIMDVKKSRCFQMTL